MSDSKPVRLTFPSYDMGAARIIADGKSEVGRVLAEFYGWRAHLWPSADAKAWHYPDGVEEVRAATLGDLRRGLRERVAEKGPWWA